MGGGRALWVLIVGIFAIFAVSGPAIMLRDALRGGGQAAGATAAGEAVVTMADLTFSPATLRVPAGSVVVWNNQDVAPHTVTTDTTDSGLIDPGASFSMPVTASFSYVCTVHPSMFGTVEVSG